VVKYGSEAWILQNVEGVFLKLPLLGVVSALDLQACIRKGRGSSPDIADYLVCKRGHWRDSVSRT